jgi:glycosyltransferase involved in cell wall biosynthesis
MGNLQDSSVTPLVLTYNEEPNIRRTLESLCWAERVVVLDSHSTDATESIARSFVNVDWQVRRFDCHRSQWEHGVRNTGIETPFILALDADMSVPITFVDELAQHFVPGNYTGAVVSFEFRILGQPLVGSIYPAQLRVFRRESVAVSQQGHTQEFSIKGSLYNFKSSLVHDDRKGLERWVSSQAAYSALEEQRLAAAGVHRWRDRLRELGLMPLIAGGLAYVRAGGPLRGAAAVRYACERTTFECLLAIRLMSSRLEKSKKSPD